jgi:predicted GIY-YIG superfamily endonuclease
MVNMESAFQIPCCSLVYCLVLENGKYYVGTSAQLNQRLSSHWEGNGSRWTKIHKPIKIYSVCLGNRNTERRVTLEIMAKFGWKNVRGGPWCKPMMHRPPSDLDAIVNSGETEVELTLVDGAATLTDSRTEAV